MDRITATKAAKLANECHKKFSLSKNVHKAIASVDREAFINSGFSHNAYKIDALPIGASQYISSPLTVAKMTEYLKPNNVDRV